MRLLNSELGRDVHTWLSCASLSTLQFVSSRNRIQIQAVWLPTHMLMAQNPISRTIHNLQNTCAQSYMLKSVYNGEKMKIIKNLFINLLVIY